VVYSGRPWLSCKYQTRLEKLAMEKHSSLLRTFVNYARKCIITMAPDLKPDVENYFKITFAN
jgi:hypothetical protein